MMKMKKFEYLVDEIRIATIRKSKGDEEAEEKLDEYGEDGWELIACIPIQNQLGLQATTTSYKIIMKKELKK